jgi:hypothetical protein
MAVENFDMMADLCGRRSVICILIPYLRHRLQLLGLNYYSLLFARLVVERVFGLRWYSDRWKLSLAVAVDDAFRIRVDD